MNNINKFHSWRRKLRWNRQYNSGRWENLKSEIEAVRYQKIIEFIEVFGNDKPSILDLGCGEGILYERMKNSDYSSFLGIDFSSVSIKNAKHLNLSNADFVCADIHSFYPKQKFDVIVFNEVFYYLHETEKLNVLNRMIECLNDDGIIVTSIYREKLGCWNYFDTLKQHDFKTVTTDNENMYWKVGVYKK